MLLEFGARNFLSFDEGFEASLRLNQQCPENISKGKEFSNILCVKGGNASGKSNVLKTTSFIADFCKNSFNYKPDEEINLFSFFNNNKPSEFFVVFKINDIEYRYELEIIRKQVISEIVYRKKIRYQKVFERKNNQIVFATKEFNYLEKIKIRKNASIISTAHQYEVNCIEAIYNFFTIIITNVKIFGLTEIGQNISKVSKLYKDNESLFEFVIDIIKKCDMGIKTIEIFEREEEGGKTHYFPIFTHELKESLEKLTYFSQSSGTRALYRILALYKIVLNIGGVLVLDEFDINLHPHILPILVELFENDDTNKNNSQIIFTTHNTSIIDKLGKYRTLFVNKENSSSYTYRLDELPGDIVRNDRPISPIYNSGKIGGVPRV